MLGSLAWWIFLGSDLFWANCMLSKYYKRNKPTKGGSFILKNILNGWKICNKGFRWVLTNGNRVNIWHNNRIPPYNNLRSLIVIHINNNKIDMKLSRLINNLNWNLDNCSFPISTSMIDRMYKIPLDSHSPSDSLYGS